MRHDDDDKLYDVLDERLARVERKLSRLTAYARQLVPSSLNGSERVEQIAMGRMPVHDTESRLAYVVRYRTLDEQPIVTERIVLCERGNVEPFIEIARQ